MARNPSWTRDELILALDLYFRLGWENIHEKNPQILELSRLLNNLPIHTERQAAFRNINGVCMKLWNLARLDPDCPGKGLDAGSKLDQIVWDEFADKKVLLAKTADSIRANHLSFAAQYSDVLNSDEEFIEGRVLTRIHIYKERNTKAPIRKKQAVLKAYGHLACEVCGFDFLAFYGNLGEGFAECHHKTPLAELRADTPTNLEDLAIVCANCHRMLHKVKPMLTIESLRQIVLGNRRSVSG